MSAVLEFQVISLSRVQIFFTTSVNVYIRGFGTAASADDAASLSHLGILSVLCSAVFPASALLS